MEFITPVEIAPLDVRLTPKSRVLMLGSCFADEVGAWLSVALGADHVCRNPFGVLYNPDSIALVLRLLMADAETRREQIENSVFLGRDGRWHSWLGSSVVSGDTREECVCRCTEAANVDLRDYDTLIITLGTDRCYRRVEDDIVVANCHKELASCFVECETDGRALEQVVAELTSAHGESGEGMSVIVTVSPYRYRKYTMHGSQLSKAHLITMVDDWCRQFGRVTYFPSYEIVLDELRDYRFYREDMLHPSEQAVRYVYERFAAAAFSPELAALVPERMRAFRASLHV